jgi:Flp pilus assembly protein TadG
MKTHKRRCGGTLVEAAVTLLLLFTFLFAIIDLGRAYNVYQAMTDAAREGARFAVAPCSLVDATGCTYNAGQAPSIADVQAKVQSYLGKDAVRNATVDVTQTGSPVTYTQVTVTEPYTFFFLPWSITIHSRAVMRNEIN